MIPIDSENVTVNRGDYPLQCCGVRVRSAGGDVSLNDRSNPTTNVTFTLFKVGYIEITASGTLTLSQKNALNSTGLGFRWGPGSYYNTSSDAYAGGSHAGQAGFNN